MADTTTKKKLVTKVASEFQVSADQIVDFLKTKGHDKVKRTSSVDEQMYNEVAAHFKKELDQVGKRQKIKEQLTEKQEEKVSVKKLVDTVTVERQHSAEAKTEPPVLSEPAGVIEPAEAAATAQPVENEPLHLESEDGAEVTAMPGLQAEKVTQADVSGVEAPRVGEPTAVSGTESVLEAPVADRSVVKEAVPKQKAEEPAPPKKEEKGLKIRGRMDLRTGRLISEEEMRMRKELEEAQKKNKEAAAQLETETQAQKKKKKKKKKIREQSAEVVPVPEVESEDDIKKRKKKKGKHPDVDQA